jgi:small glutamine-rich tetratricopeptide repeat-containing protein alpha
MWSTIRIGTFQPSEPAISVLHNHIRAAAHSQLGKHIEAIEDCRRAIDLDPNYSKAYSRLGLALFSLDQFQDAVDAYKKALALDPNNEIVKSSLRTAESRLQPSSQPMSPEPLSSATADRSAPSADTGMPDLGGLSSLLNNPALMGMASQLMQNPQMAAM